MDVIHLHIGTCGEPLNSPSGSTCPNSYFRLGCLKPEVCENPFRRMDASDDLSPVLEGVAPKELHFDKAMLSTSATSSCLCVCDANSTPRAFETINHMSYVMSARR